MERVMRFLRLAFVLPVFACSASSTETVTSPALSSVALSAPPSGPGGTHDVVADLSFVDGSSRVCTAHMKIDSLRLDDEYTVPEGIHSAHLAMSLSETGSFNVEVGVTTCQGVGVSNVYPIHVE
jgi:hypothetical protein